MGVSSHVQKRILTVFMLLNAFITPGGIIYGWPGFTDLLKKEGQYREGCESEDFDETCGSQDNKLNNIFAVGANIATVATIVYGFTLDRYGVRLNALSGALLMCVGFVLVGLSDAREGGSMDAFMPGFSMIAFGGLGTYLSAFQFRVLFKRPTMILAIQSALFGLSGLTFTFFKFLAEQHDISRKTSFLGYACLVAFCALSMLLLYPRYSYQPGDSVQLPVLVWLGLADAPVQPIEGTVNSDMKGSEYSPLEDGGDSENSLEAVARDPETGDQLVVSKEESLVVSAEDLAFLQDEQLRRELSPLEKEQIKMSRTLKQEVLDWGTILVAMDFSIGLLCCNFYNANIGSVLKDMGDKNGNYTSAFVFIVSIYPCLFSLSIDYLQRTIRFAGMSFGATTLLILSTATLFVKSLPLQILSFFLLGTGRALLITGMFSFVATQYRGDHYGRVVAFITTICACVGLLQLAMQKLLNGPADNDFDYFSAGMIISMVPLYGFSYWCYRRRI